MKKQFILLIIAIVFVSAFAGFRFGSTEAAPSTKTEVSYQTTCNPSSKAAVGSVTWANS